MLCYLHPQLADLVSVFPPFWGAPLCLVFPLVSAHAHGDLLNLFYDLHRGETLNCTHYVHSLMFGDESDALLRGVDQAAVAPLNGAKKIAIMEPGDRGEPRSYEYYIKVNRQNKTKQNKQSPATSL